MSKIVVIILAIVLLLLCLCGAAAIWLGKRSLDEATRNDAQPSASAAPSTPGAAAQDPGSFAAGDCVVNEGSSGDARLRKVPCAPGTYEIVARILFTADRAKCDSPGVGAGPGQYDTTYTHPGRRAPMDSFVLCMKKR